MQAQSLPLAYGYLWIQGGWRLFKAQPMALLFWSLATHILLQISFLLPLIGQATLLVLTPGMTFIVLNASKRIQEGHTMRMADWLSPVKAEAVRKALIRLGFLYMLCSLIIAFIAIAPFMSNIMQSVDEHGQVEFATLLAAMQKPMTVFTILYLLLSGLFWHAPALVGWHAIPIKQALFYSMVACWRNKWAFILYGAFWFVLIYASKELANILLANGIQSASAQFILTPINMALMAVLYASFYPAYQTIFRRDNNTDH